MNPQVNTQRVECPTHGPSEPREVCQHLIAGSGLDYYRALPRPGADDFETALCAACDELVGREGSWSDRLDAFAGWQLFCVQCYDATLARHREVGWAFVGPE